MYGDTAVFFPASQFNLALGFDPEPSGDVAAEGQFPLFMNFSVMDDYLPQPEPRSCLDDFFNTLFFFRHEGQAHARGDVIWPAALEAICNSDNSINEESDFSFSDRIDLGLRLTAGMDVNLNYL